MFKHANVVDVSLNGTAVGKLALTPDNVCAFEYDADYLNHGQSISPFYLPLKPGVFISTFTAQADYCMPVIVSLHSIIPN